MCDKIFDRKVNYKTHYENKHPHINFDEKLCLSSKVLNDKKKYVCNKCGNEYTRLDNLKRHMVDSCKNYSRELIDISSLGMTKDEFIKVIEKMKNIDNLRPIINNNHNHNHNHLHVTCVSESDNYLDILTDKMGGNFDMALSYVANCALSRLTGDCKLLEKIYFDPSQNSDDYDYAIKCEKNNKMKIKFREKKTMDIIEVIEDKNGDELSRLLGKNLQDAYLGALKLNAQIKLIGDKKLKPIFENFDETECLDHVHSLSDKKYQKILIKNLNIPH